MKINNDKLKINELEMALSYFIKGIIVDEKKTKFLDSIQRIIENSIVFYNVVDIKKRNFLEINNIIFDKTNNKIIATFNNKQCNYKKQINEIKVCIPFMQFNSKKTLYNLNGSVEIIIYTNINN